MQTDSAGLRAQFLHALWGAWTALGVSGWERQRAPVTLDPEPLIILTAALGTSDARLRDEVIDWCILAESLLSRTRLRALVRGWDLRPGQWAEFAGTVSSHTKTAWPGAGASRRYRPSGKSELRVLGTEAGLALRVRAGLGVSARAEIVSLLLCLPTQAVDTRDVASRTGYTSRTVTDAYKALQAGGLVQAVTTDRAARWKLVPDKEFRSAFGPVPSAYPAWQPLLSGLWRLYRTVEAHENAPPAIRSVEARETLLAARATLARAGIQLPIPGPGSDAWTVLTSSIGAALDDLTAAPLPRALDTRGQTDA